MFKQEQNASMRKKLTSFMQHSKIPEGYSIEYYKGIDTIDVYGNTLKTTTHIVGKTKEYHYPSYVFMDSNKNHVFSLNVNLELDISIGDDSNDYIVSNWKEAMEKGEEVAKQWYIDNKEYL